MKRTHTCGQLNESQVGQTVILSGWVNTYRAYNDQIFVDLRDRYGITQVVFEADGDAAAFAPPAKLAANGCWRSRARCGVVCRARPIPSWPPAPSKCWSPS